MHNVNKITRIFCLVFILAFSIKRVNGQTTPSYQDVCEEQLDPVYCPIYNEFLLIGDVLKVLRFNTFFQNIPNCPGQAWNSSNECSFMGAKQFVEDTCATGKRCENLALAGGTYRDIQTLYKVNYFCCVPRVIPNIPALQVPTTAVTIHGDPGSQTPSPFFQDVCEEPSEPVYCPRVNEYYFIGDVLKVLRFNDFFGTIPTCPRLNLSSSMECSPMGVKQSVQNMCSVGKTCDMLGVAGGTHSVIIGIYMVNYFCCVPRLPASYLTMQAPDLVRYQSPGVPVTITLSFSEVLLRHVEAEQCLLSYGDGETGTCAIYAGDPVLSLVHVYRSAGCYNLFVNVTSTSLSADASQVMCVLPNLEGVLPVIGAAAEEMEDDDLFTDPDDFVFLIGQILVVNVFIETSVTTEYEWIVDGNRTILLSPWIHPSFDELGDHTVSVVVSNNLSCSYTATRIFRIIDLAKPPCNPSTVQIAGPRSNSSSPLTFPRHVPLSFRVNTDLSCNLTFTVTPCWTVFKSDSDNETLLTLSPSVVAHLSEINLPKGSLAYGLYALQIDVNVVTRGGYHYPIGHKADRVWVRIRPSPLVAVIQGGSERSVGYSSSLTLDGSGSYDPDNFLDPHGGLMYTWHCAVVPVPNQESPVTTPCFGGGHLLPFNSSTVQIAPNSLSPGEVYKFTLTVGQTGRENSSTSQLISVVAYDPPVLSISCLQNCEIKLNVGERIVLSATSPTPSVSYAWDVLTQDNAPDETFDWESQTTTGRYSSYLAVVGGAFDDGHYRERSIKVTGSQPGGPPGFAVFTFQLNAPPHIGTCSLVPEIGYALQTHFVISCVDFWDEEGHLKYTVRVPPLRKGMEKATLKFLDPVLYSGADSTTPSVYLPLGDASEDYQVTIAVDVADIHGATVEFTTTAQVQPPAAVNLNDDRDTSQALLNLTKGRDSELQGLLDKGDYQTAVQFIGAVGSILDSHDASSAGSDHGESEENKALREEIRTSTVNTIASMPVESVVSLQQSSYALVAITQDKTEVTQETQLTAATTLVKMGAFLKEHSVDRTECESCQTSIDDAALNLVSGLSNILDAAVSSVEELGEIAVETIEEGNGTESGTTGPVDVTAEEVRGKSREVAKATLAAISDVQDALIVNKVPGEEPSIISSPVLTLTSQRQEQGTLGQTPIGVSESEPSGFILPDTVAIDTFLPSHYMDAVDTQMVQFMTDPFVWSKGSEDVTSQVVGLQLKTVQQTGIKVANLVEDIQVFLPKRAVIVTNNTAVNLTRTTTVIITFEVDNPNATVSVLVLPTDATARLACCLRFQENGSAWNVTKDDCYVNVTLPGEESTYHLPIEDRDGILKQQFTWMVQPSHLYEKGHYQVLCSRADWEQSANQDVLTVQIGVYSSQCLFWNEEKEKWDPSGCRVGPLSTPEITQCLCNHLTYFGSSLFVMPNKIDFLADFKLFLTFVDNPVVVTTVAFILAVYVIVAVWARRKDKADMLKVCVITLEDNDPFAHYRYNVTIVTGVRRGAGTTATVTLTLIGTRGKSRPHVLQDKRRAVLQRGDADSFLITTKQSLGDVTNVRIWHNNGGKSPEWYVSRITVHDLETDEWWFLLCNAWLAVDIAEGLIDRTFPTATEKDLKNFGHLFSTRTVKDLQDGHLWFSIFSRPPRSTFTRLQRVSCCLSLLMCIMLTSIMFYGVPTNPSEQALDFGSFRITFTEILIGIESSILSFPINLLIVTIFRKARPAESTPKSAKSRKYSPRQSSSGSDAGPSFEDSESEADMIGFSTDTTYDTARQRPFNEDITSTEVSSFGEDNFSLSSVDTKRQQAHNAYLFSCLDQLVDDLDLMTPESFSSPEQYLLAKQEARKIVLTVMSIRTPSSSLSDLPNASSSASQTACRKFIGSIIQNGLPHWSIYIGWILVFFTTLVSSYFTMLYGLRYGNQRSIDWLVSLVVSMFQSIFFIQPIKVLLFAAFIALVMKRWDADDDGSSDLEEREVENAHVVYNKLLRKWKSDHYRPPTAAAVNTSRQRKELKRKMYALLREIIGYVFFIWLVLIISYSQRDRHAYYLAQNIKDVFFSNDEYDSITSFDGFFEWAEMAMIPGLYEGDETEETMSFLVGGIRLRQLRVVPGSCPVNLLARSDNSRCMPPYSLGTEDTGSYNHSWSPLNQNKEENDASGLQSMWDFQENLANKRWGRVTSYPGRGYVADLGRNRTRTGEVLAVLKVAHWLDCRTRALVVEWTVYNANTNLFCAVTLLVEIPATGGFLKTPSIQAVRLYRNMANFKIFVLCIEVLFTVYTVFYMIVELRKMQQEGRSYLRNGWNWLEVAIILTCVVVIAVYVYRYVATETLLKGFRLHPGRFINFHDTASVAEAFNHLLGFLLILCTVKFLYLLRLNPTTYLLTSVLTSSANDVGIFAGYIGLFMIAFTMLFQLFFGKHIAMYSTLILAFESLFALFLGEYDYEELYSVSGPLAFLLVIIFQGVATVLLLNVLISVLVNNMSFVRQNQEPNEDGKIGMLLIYKILSWFGIKHKAKI